MLNRRARKPGLLPKDEQPIKLVSAERRKFWEQIPTEAKIDTAPKWRKKWSDEEVRRVLTADPSTDSYVSLANELHRSPGSIRVRRAQMIAILRGEPYADEYVQS